ncbi:MAG: family 43 glycosylhydrolase [Micrococcales bacterium]
MANPAIDKVFLADPAAHVFGERLYAYVSYDQPFTNTHDSMISYHCVSTDDMVNWVDHGQILALEYVPWALSHMWAIDCNFWQGSYYLVFCAFDKATGTFRTGLAVSDRPEGPFDDLGVIEGVEWGQDPSFFVDEVDGVQTPYLIWGGRGAITMAELNPDLRSVKVETITDLSGDLEGYEGPFLHKHAGTYYLTYPALDNEKWPQRMCFATAKSPLGPYLPGGVFIPEYEGNSGTIHGSMVEFKGQWYAFYHSAWVSGLSTSRSMMVDRFEYGSQGEILPFEPSRAGATGAAKNSYTAILDAAAGETSGARRHGTRVETAIAGFTGHGYVDGLTGQETGASVQFDWAGPDESATTRIRVSVRYRNAGSDFNGRVLFGNQLFYDGNQNQSYEQYINRGTVFPSTDGQWRELEIGVVEARPGSYRVRLSASHNLSKTLTAEAAGGIQLDYFKFEPID